MVAQFFCVVYEKANMTFFIICTAPCVLTLYNISQMSKYSIYSICLKDNNFLNVASR